MRKEVLISLGDENLKGLGEVLGSKTCVAILDLLAAEDLTVSDIARKLGMKLNTADYNVHKLVGVGLIEKGSHWWSVKGKKMSTYRVVDRRIVISPRRKVAAKFLWVLGLTGAAAFAIQRFAVDNLNSLGNVVPLSDTTFDSVPKIEMLASDIGAKDMSIGSITNVGFFGNLAGWEWFLIGAWGAVVLFFIFSLIDERRKR